MLATPKRACEKGIEPLRTEEVLLLIKWQAIKIASLEITRSMHMEKKHPSNIQQMVVLTLNNAILLGWLGISSLM